MRRKAAPTAFPTELLLLITWSLLPCPITWSWWANKLFAHRGKYENQPNLHIHHPAWAITARTTATQK